MISHPVPTKRNHSDADMIRLIPDRLRPEQLGSTPRESNRQNWRDVNPVTDFKLISKIIEMLVPCTKSLVS